MNSIPTASPEFKQVLEDTFGREFFNRKITDRVKTYEDACAVLGIDPHTSMPDTSDCPKEDRRAYIAFHKLVVITRALNEGVAARLVEYRPAQVVQLVVYER